MRKPILALFAMMPLAAPAVPLVSSSACPTESSFTCIAGIDGLTVSGADYDLSVVVGTFESLFSDPDSQLLSWGDSAFAIAANEAIASALNASPLSPSRADTKFHDSGALPSRDTVLHLPVEFQLFSGDPTGAFRGPCATILSSGVAAASCASWLTDITVGFAVLSPSTDTPVSEPVAIGLLGVGLLGLGLTGRRKRAA